VKCDKIEQFPAEYGCNVCGKTKPAAEMVVVYMRREKRYYLRPRCKACHNEKERGQRREWKRAYLQKWRKKNAKVNESYWKDNPIVREQARVNAMKRFKEKHEAILIQGRMNRRGMQVSLKEAEELLRTYGRCYPTAFGLTENGKRECERIRASLRRRKSKRISNFHIRLMVYEDGMENAFVIAPALQPQPYRHASEQLRQWHRNQRILRDI